MDAVSTNDDIKFIVAGQEAAIIELVPEGGSIVTRTKFNNSIIL